MQNVVVNMCEKFHDDRLRNDRSLGNRKSDNNKNNNKNNVRSAWSPVSGSKKKAELTPGLARDRAATWRLITVNLDSSTAIDCNSRTCAATWRKR